MTGGVSDESFRMIFVPEARRKRAAASRGETWRFPRTVGEILKVCVVIDAARVVRSLEEGVVVGLLKEFEGGKRVLELQSAFHTLTGRDTRLFSLMGEPICEPCASHPWQVLCTAIPTRSAKVAEYRQPFELNP
jgi:hypothetical protein